MTTHTAVTNGLRASLIFDGWCEGSGGGGGEVEERKTDRRVEKEWERKCADTDTEQVCNVYKISQPSLL